MGDFIDRNGQNVQASVDGSSVVVMSTEHHSAHTGLAYTTMGKFPAVAAAGTAFFYLATSTNSVHLKAIEAASSGAKLTIEIWEGGTVVANGTVAPAINKNRKSVNVAMTVVYTTPTTPVPTTLIDTAFIPAAGWLKAYADGGTDQEFVLKASTNYFIKLTNGDAGPADLFARLAWSELE